MGRILSRTVLAVALTLGVTRFAPAEACAQEPIVAAAEQGRGDAGEGALFDVDALTGWVVVGASWLTSLITEALIDTGEIEAQLPDDENELLFLDRWAAERDSASRRAAFASDVGLVLVGFWGIVDTSLAAVGQREDGFGTYLLLYMESAGITWLLGNLVKMAVRRPRPRAYIELRQEGTIDPVTQEALSFYSLHTAMSASLGATASYLAFTRDASALERWLVLVGSAAATAVVGLGRTLAAAHFVTDVLAGAVMGTAVGLLVPHAQRSDDVGIRTSIGPAGGTLDACLRW